MLAVGSNDPRPNDTGTRILSSNMSQFIGTSNLVDADLSSMDSPQSRKASSLKRDCFVSSQSASQASRLRETTPHTFCDENAERNLFLKPNIDCSICESSSLVSVDLTTPSVDAAVPGLMAVVKSPHGIDTIDISSSFTLYSEISTSVTSMNDANAETADLSRTLESNMNEMSDNSRNDEEESIRLAMTLMEEEALELEQRQRQFMLSNATDLSPEDLAAIREIVGSNIDQTIVTQNLLEEDDGIDEESERWDYDQLLELGHALGGT